MCLEIMLPRSKSNEEKDGKIYFLKCYMFITKFYPKKCVLSYMILALGIN